MSEQDQANHGQYDTLPKSYIDRAYIENELFDIDKRRNDLSKAAESLDRLARAEYSATVEGLLSDPDITDEDLLAGYQTALTNAGDGRGLRRFDEMMAMRDSLYEGQVILAGGVYGSDVAKIARQSESDESPIAHPVVESTGHPNAAFTTHQIRWRVQLDNGRTGVIGQNAIVGHDAIVEYLQHSAAFKFDELAPQQQLSVGNAFRAVGEPETADRLVEAAVSAAYNELTDRIRSRRDRFDSRSIIENLEVLDSAATNVIPILLDELAAAAVRYRGSYDIEIRLDVVSAYLEFTAGKAAQSSGDAEYEIPTQKQVLTEYVRLMERGEALLAEAQATEEEAIDISR